MSSVSAGAAHEDLWHLETVAVEARRLEGPVRLIHEQGMIDGHGEVDVSKVTGAGKVREFTCRAAVTGETR